MHSQPSRAAAPALAAAVRDPISPSTWACRPLCMSAAALSSCFAWKLVSMCRHVLADHSSGLIGAVRSGSPASATAASSANPFDDPPAASQARPASTGLSLCLEDVDVASKIVVPEVLVSPHQWGCGAACPAGNHDNVNAATTSSSDWPSSHSAFSAEIATRLRAGAPSKLQPPGAKPQPSSHPTGGAAPKPSWPLPDEVDPFADLAVIRR